MLDIHKKSKIGAPVIILLFILSSCKEAYTTDKSLMETSNMTSLFNAYDSSPMHTFGRLNPDAPIQTQQFDFMIGIYQCQDSLLVNGAWQHSEATWESHYILNGYAIKDTYRNSSYAGTSIRLFNTTKNKWEVHFFGMPGEHTGLWEGEEVDGKMIMRQQRTGPKGEKIESRLTFHSITNSSFEWRGELWNLDDKTVTVNWKIRAQKKL